MYYFLQAHTCIPAVRTATCVICMYSNYTSVQCIYMSVCVHVDHRMHMHTNCGVCMGVVSNHAYVILTLTHVHTSMLYIPVCYTYQYAIVQRVPIVLCGYDVNCSCSRCVCECRPSVSWVMSTQRRLINLLFNWFITAPN